MSIQSCTRTREGGLRVYIQHWHCGWERLHRTRWRVACSCRSTSLRARPVVRASILCSRAWRSRRLASHRLMSSAALPISCHLLSWRSIRSCVKRDTMISSTVSAQFSITDASSRCWIRLRTRRIISNVDFLACQKSTQAVNAASTDRLRIAAAIRRTIRILSTSSHQALHACPCARLRNRPRIASIFCLCSASAAARSSTLAATNLHHQSQYLLQTVLCVAWSHPIRARRCVILSAKLRVLSHVCQARK